VVSLAVLLLCWWFFAGYRGCHGSWLLSVVSVLATALVLLPFYRSNPAWWRRVERVGNTNRLGIERVLWQARVVEE